MNCPVCNRELPANYTRMYCSVSCRQSAYRARKQLQIDQAFNSHYNMIKTVNPVNLRLALYRTLKQLKTVI